jgi:tRNA-(ms[2]io[6]A)-hydroxylase
LLVNALIEARSCERFKLMSEALADPSLRAFYRDLMESEARHYRLFCALSEELFGVKLARARLTVLAEREAQVASKLPLGPKVHG